jgi:hypothetical protein
LLKEFGRAGAHSLASGTFSHLQGGNFWHGAAAGGISSLGGSTMQAKKFSDPAMITGSAALGGLGSMIVGGDFWQGFGQGMAVGLFNHAMQNGINKIRDKIAKNAENEIGSTAWNIDAEIDDFAAGSNKCNKFVYDMLATTKANSGTPNGLFKDNPPTAGQWADPKYEIPGWKRVYSPKRGDIVAYQYNYSDATGHVAIVVSNTRAYKFSVGTSGSQNAIAKTSFGFSNNTNYLPKGANYVYRRYVGK